ncbi:MAG: BatD family protein, partial [Thermoanaerobaculia bacterium]
MAALTLATMPAHASAVVTAEIDPTEITIGDRVRLTVRIESESMTGNVDTPRLPRLTNFEIAGGPSTSTSFRWVNGRTSGSKTFSYILAALKEGEAVIPPIEVTVAGEVLR